MPVLLRSAASNEGAANRLWEIFAQQVFPVVASAGDPATGPQNDSALREAPFFLERPANVEAECRCCLARSRVGTIVGRGS